MAIKFEYRGMHFSADTAEEAAALVRILQEREPSTTPVKTGSQRWDAGEFRSYLHRLGESQTTFLAYLVIHQTVTDDEIRSLLKKSGNQAIGGVLSGLTRQAEAMSIDPQAVFTTRYWRSAGKRHSEYKIAPELWRVARELRWPTDPEMFSENS